MAFAVNFYTFSKKANSTKIPTSGATVYNCIIKEPCGILNPTISLDLGLTTNPSQFNYAYIATFNRYYFVKEWLFQDAMWSAELEVDALASWKTSIGGTSAYVLRSSTDHDGSIMDATYPATGITTIITSTQPTPFAANYESGWFIIGVAGISTRYYVMDEPTLNSILGYMFSDDYAAQLTAGWNAVFPQLKAQCNPIQYITTIMWVPFYPNADDVSSVFIGWVEIPIAAKEVHQALVNQFLQQGVTTFPITRHPQADRGSYLNNAPYSSYSLYFPPWGKIQLDADVVANSNNIVAQWYIDLRTCEGTLFVKNENGYILSVLHAQIGVQHQTAQIMNKGFGLGNVIQPLIGIAASGAFAGDIGAIAGAAGFGASMIGDVAGSKIPTATTIGHNGGLDGLIGIPTLQHEFKEIVDDDYVHRGRPLCTINQISTLGGYLKTMNVSIDIPATQNEKNIITGYLEGGFYYE